MRVVEPAHTFPLREAKSIASSSSLLLELFKAGKAGKASEAGNVGKVGAVSARSRSRCGAIPGR